MKWTAGCWLAAVLLVSPPGTAQGTLEDCRGLRREFPLGEEGPRCLHELYSNEPSVRIVEEIEQWAAGEPGAPWVQLYLALIRWRSGSRGVDEALERAIEGFPEAERSGKIRALAELVTWLAAEHRVREAGLRLEEARALSDELPELTDRVRVDVAEVHLRFVEGRDLQGVYQRLTSTLGEIRRSAARESPGALTPDLLYELELDFLWALGNVTWLLGLHDETRRHFEERLALTLRRKNPSGQAKAVYDLIAVRLDWEAPDRASRRDVVGELEKALALASEGGSKEIEALALRFLVELAPDATSRAKLERCLRLAKELGYPEVLREAFLSFALFVAQSDPAEARELLRKAYDEGLTHRNPWALVYGWRHQLLVLWETDPRAALRAGEILLGAVEELRTAQTGEARDRLYSTWAGAYYWLSGALLESRAGEGSGPFVASSADEEETVIQALAFLERLRDRRRMELEGALLTEPGDAVELDRMYRTYEHLLSRAWSGDEPEVAGPRLDHRILAPQRLDRLAGARAELNTGEALVSFQLAHDEGFDRRFAGGSWSTLLTRDELRVYRLPEMARIERHVECFMDRDCPDRAEAGAWLYDELLAGVAGDLPGEVHRLILVPDGILHRLSFTVLRPSSAAPYLIEDFELATVPSVTQWLDWRQSAASSPSGETLILVPESGQETLLWTACEGWCVERHLGGELLAGAAATEDAIAGRAGDFDVLHFATHARVDGRWPLQSYVELAPSTAQGDGRLTFEEILDLPLDGQVVMLSTCDSGLGEILRGEGAMSLARAFFRARARAVVATLRVLPDREGSEFFDRVYRELSAGRSLASALAETQRAWIARRGSPEVWQNVVVLGDGDRVLAAGEPGKLRWPRWAHPACWPTSLPLVLIGAVLVYGALRRAGRRGRGGET